jgi:hypothetical protein
MTNFKRLILLLLLASGVSFAKATATDDDQRYRHLGTGNTQTNALQSKQALIDSAMRLLHGPIFNEDAIKSQLHQIDSSQIESLIDDLNYITDAKLYVVRIPAADGERAVIGVDDHLVNLITNVASTSYGRSNFVTLLSRLLYLDKEKLDSSLLDFLRAAGPILPQPNYHFIAPVEFCLKHVRVLGRCYPQFSLQDRFRIVQAFDYHNNYKRVEEKEPITDDEDDYVIYVDTGAGTPKVEVKPANNDSHPDVIWNGTPLTWDQAFTYPELNGLAYRTSFKMEEHESECKEIVKLLDHYRPPFETWDVIITLRQIPRGERGNFVTNLSRFMKAKIYHGKEGEKTHIDRQLVDTLRTASTSPTGRSNFVTLVLKHLKDEKVTIDILELMKRKIPLTKLNTALSIVKQMHPQVSLAERIEILGNPIGLPCEDETVLIPY